MATKFICDSSCDLWTGKDGNLSSVPLTISTDQKTFTDDETLNISEMMNYLSEHKGRSYTACPSIEGWLNSFGDADRIYVLTMTSTLSGTYNSAMTAKNMYLKSHPDAQIHVFDTLSTGPEMRLLLEKLMELERTEASFEAVCQKAREYLSGTRLFFALKSLHNLAQNGRVPKVLASAIGILGISILATASPEGTIDPINKCRGEKKVILSLLKQIENAGYKGGKVRISHIENPELAEKLRQTILTKYPRAGIEIYPAHGLCSYYAEKGGIMVGCEC